MNEILRGEEMHAAAAGTTPRVVTLRFSSETTRDARRYNVPAVEEVVAIFVGEDGPQPIETLWYIHVRLSVDASARHPITWIQCRTL